VKTCRDVDAPKAVEPANVGERHLLIAKVRALAIGLVEQQATPDDWWRPHLEDILSSLATMAGSTA
jgi:hypothetical protein